MNPQHSAFPSRSASSTSQSSARYGKPSTVGQSVALKDGIAGVRNSMDIAKPGTMASFSATTALRLPSAPAVRHGTTPSMWKGTRNSSTQPLVTGTNHQPRAEKFDAKRLFQDPSSVPSVPGASAPKPGMSLEQYMPPLPSMQPKIVSRSAVKPQGLHSMPQSGTPMLPRGNLLPLDASHPRVLTGATHQKFDVKRLFQDPSSVASVSGTPNPGMSNTVSGTPMLPNSPRVNASRPPFTGHRSAYTTPSPHTRPSPSFPSSPAPISPAFAPEQSASRLYRPSIQPRTSKVMMSSTDGRQVHLDERMGRTTGPLSPTVSPSGVKSWNKGVRTKSLSGDQTSYQAQRELERLIKQLEWVRLEPKIEQETGNKHNNKEVRPDKVAVAGDAPKSPSRPLALSPAGNRPVPRPLSSLDTASSPTHSPDGVGRMAPALLTELTELTEETFDSVSNQIIMQMNESEDERTLVDITRSVLKTAVDEPTLSELYARLCRRMMDQLSLNVRHGDELFRWYLLNQSLHDAKRRALGLSKFIGELFRVWIVTEHVMHECVKKLLTNVLTTVGQQLDTPEARAQVDVYFTHLTGWANNSNVNLNIIELRARGWASRDQDAAPCSIPAWAQVGAQYTTTTVASLQNDLSHFGKGSKTNYMTSGPSGVFAKDRSKGGPTSARDPNMFSQLMKNPERSAEPEAAQSSIRPVRKASIDFDSVSTSRDPWRRRELDPLQRTAPEPNEHETASTPAQSDAVYSDDEDYSVPPMTEDEAKSQVSEDSREFFSTRDLDEAEVYFGKLPSEHRWLLVDKLVASAFESNDADAQLVADFLSRAVSKNLCSRESLEKGFNPTAEVLDDIAACAWRAFNMMSMMKKGAGLRSSARLSTKPDTSL
ncbi:uncharacterized protein B0H18DRAFT_1027823 [Fomitopsis serialis]|uniref:uncharacterized protein n=1 Tax=Fomitopsis serialis TaxID=139415 RepID=UPI002007B4C5|nr:uncharacterized protein B0H18DRAFT_1027823 [Neoantrodia serialis]KAH9919377.1 hypothetical protein B0H18DRAFT_1027823 [Neoantrodia serialis]